MDFFEPPPVPDPAPRPEPPEWLAPPDNVLGVPFLLARELAWTDQVAMQVHSGRAFPNGFEFALDLRRREPSSNSDPFRAWLEAQETGSIPPEALRIGIEFGDGSKATVFETHRLFSSEEQPTGPVLVQRGGSGGGRAWEFVFWVWPLPPPGTLSFVSEWPVEQIELTRTSIQADEVRRAAANAQELWPGGEPEWGGSWLGGGQVG